jgi:hypothetical protein
VEDILSQKAAQTIEGRPFSEQVVAGWGLELQKLPDPQVAFPFANPCRMTGVYAKGVYGVCRTGVSGAVSTRVSVCCRAANLPMVGGYHNCGMRGADNPGSRYPSLSHHTPRSHFMEECQAMRDISRLIRRPSLAGWKRWGHLPRLGQSG